MTDVFSKSKRSEIMSGIHSKETKPEILVRKYLFSQGFRFRKNVRKLPGTPDIVLPKYKIVIFVHGCFWHGHENCKRSELPTSNHLYWKEKIVKNTERDKSNILDLTALGWEVLIVWECDLMNRSLREVRLSNLCKEIKNIGNNI